MTCDLCGHHEKPTPTDDEVAYASADLALMFDHLRLLHPDEWGDGPERWPDGDVVLYDDTIEPADFGTVSE